MRTRDEMPRLEGARSGREAVSRLYRGLTKPYRPEQVPPRGALSGTDFTDCPFTALRYATGRRGVVLVLELPAFGGPFVSEEDWLGMEARRFMVWGGFDRYIVGIHAAKDLRAEVRRKGMRAQPNAVKSAVLERFLEGLG